VANGSRDLWASFMCAMCALPACTDANLYGKVGQEPELANKVALTGVLCTDDPSKRKFPVKIMFIVDGSSQMQEAAPGGEQIEAVQQTLSEYLPIPNVYVSIIRYDSRATSLITDMIGQVTTPFTRDPIKVETAIQNLRNAMSTGERNFPSALSLARSLLTGDAFQADKGPLSRTKYVVVHITSGSPAPPVLPTQCDGVFPTRPPVCEVALLEKQIRDVRDQILSLGAAEFAFHVAYIEEPRIEGPACDPRRGSVDCTSAPGLTCVQAGKRADTGRCVQVCDPMAPVCTAFPTQPKCVAADLPDGTTINYCARGETQCFDGKDNDRNMRGVDCMDPSYPYDCTMASAGGCEPACRSACRTEKIGIAMSLAAGGRYTRFPYTDQINFVTIDFRSTQRIFVMKEFFASNRNAVPQGDSLMVDTDADGLTDDQEIAIGTDPLNPDTDGDYFNDRLEHILRTLRLDPIATSSIADCPDPTIDTDGDELRDCEEKLLGSDKTLFDTDADGFPDGLEFRVGTNLLANDALEDLDLDGVNNGLEIKAHTDVLANDAKTRSELAYRSRIKDLGPTTDERTCYDIRISNITLVSQTDPVRMMLMAAGQEAGVNHVDVFFGQVPSGDLGGYGVFHVAQVRLQYFPPNRRDPDAPALDLQDGDFTTFEQ
jgi:VWA domain-containing protein/thrombospondin type 3 repeat protein